MPLLLLASISLFFYPSLVYGRGGACFVFFPPASCSPSRNNPGCIVRVGAQVRRIIGTTLDFVVYALGWGTKRLGF
ncbi:hypothetical protein V8C43DRAFT_287681 [Trichoderma afarasin]